MNNFELTNEVKFEFGVKFYRIIAARDLPCGVKKGDLGGWVSDNARVSDNAWVYGDA